MTKKTYIGYGLILIALILIAAVSALKVQLDDQGAYMCLAVAQDPYTPMSECPAHNDNSSWIIMILFGGSLVVLGAGIFLVLDKEKQPTKKKPASLGEEEKKIHELLTNNDGSMYQGDLVRETGYSKVKLTRILDKLETKGHIERKRRGMTNIVVLK